MNWLAAKQYKSTPRFKCHTQKKVRRTEQLCNKWYCRVITVRSRMRAADVREAKTAMAIQQKAPTVSLAPEPGYDA